MGCASCALNLMLIATNNHSITLISFELIASILYILEMQNNEATHNIVF